jgi:hypothetical protein
MQNGRDLRAINTIERILECAVCLNWKDFALNSLPMTMQLEYRSGLTHSLDSLKLWSSTSRGYWNLVCEYWMQSSTTHQQGITFTGTYSSPALTRMLDAIMHHQDAFSRDSTELLDGLVQVASPNETQSAAARLQMSQALERITSRTPPGEMATWKTTMSFNGFQGHAMKLYVGNLGFTITDIQLGSLFAQYGTVVSERVIRNQATGHGRGFRFVEMSDPEARQAMQLLNG